MPLLFPELPVASRLIAHLEDEKMFAAPYPVPTVAVSDPKFVPGVVGTKLVWRGPSWMSSNWYLARGLRAHGRSDLAQKIAAASLETVRKHGFREYWNPFSGEGHGAPDFSWTALVLDLYETAA
jgi:glycogen debranching enzyme